MKMKKHDERHKILVEQKRERERESECCKIFMQKKLKILGSVRFANHAAAQTDSNLGKGLISSNASLRRQEACLNEN